jgi:hypothetical protein
MAFFCIYICVFIMIAKEEVHISCNEDLYVLQWIYILRKVLVCKKLFPCSPDCIFFFLCQRARITRAFPWPIQCYLKGIRCFLYHKCVVHLSQLWFRLCLSIVCDTNSHGINRYVDAIMKIPKGTLFRMWGMNLAFNRELIGPAMYFDLMGEWTTYWFVWWYVGRLVLQGRWLFSFQPFQSAQDTEPY